MRLKWFVVISFGWFYFFLLDFMALVLDITTFFLPPPGDAILGASHFLPAISSIFMVALDSLKMVNWHLSPTFSTKDWAQLGQFSHQIID